MNVKNLIQQIELRPGMYTGKLDLEAISHFISGFLYNNIITDRADDVDIAFKNKFDGWVKSVLEERENIKFDEQRNYIFYISQVYKDPKQKLVVFFKLCSEFFDKI